MALAENRNASGKIKHVLEGEDLAHNCKEGLHKRPFAAESAIAAFRSPMTTGFPTGCAVLQPCLRLSFYQVLAPHDRRDC